MLIAILGDTHWGVRNDSIIFRDNHAKFYRDIFFPTLKSRGIKEIIQTGDFFDKRKHINFTTLKHVKDEFIHPCREEGIHIVELLGNHDIYFKDTVQVNSPEQLADHYDHFDVITEPTTLDYDGCKIDIIPWICAENHEKIYDFLSVSTSSIVCGHFEFKGFDMYRGIPAQKGSTTEIFNKFDKVISGHFHTRSSRGNVEYVGTPYEMTWADCNDRKGFHIFDTETGDLEFIENPYTLHHKILYDDEANDYDKYPLDTMRGGFIRIIVSKKTSEATLERFVERIWTECDPADLSLTDTSVAYRDEDIGAIDTQDPLTVLIANVIRDTDKEAAAVKRIIQEIYQEALSLGVME